MPDDEPRLAEANPMISVLIVDDHPIVRQGLRTLLELQDDILVVGEAVNGKSLWNLPLA